MLVLNTDATNSYGVTMSHLLYLEKLCIVFTGLEDKL